MNRLFWKVFFLCWISNTLVIGLMLGLIAWTEVVPPPALGRRGETHRHQRMLRRTAAILRNHGDTPRFRQRLQGPRSGFPILVFDAEGNELLGRKVNDDARSLATAALGDSDDHGFSGDRFMGRTVTTPNGNRLAVVQRHDHRLISRLWRRPTMLVIRLIEIVVAAGIVAFVLARYITRPMNRLRTATQNLAGGELSTRVGPSVARRRDVIGELARDFDDMAGKVESLVSSQKRLLRDVAHELRSPLARLHVAHGLALRNAPKESKAALERIELEVGRLTILIDQLLSLEGIEALAQPPRDENVAMVELLHDLVADARFESAGRGITVKLKVNEECTSNDDGTPNADHPNCECYVAGHPGLIHSAIENVIRNAMEYTPDRSTVSVSLMADQQTVTVEVADQGPGVDPASLQAIFEPFYRTASARDRASGGTGLGLAISRRAVSAHNGTITAQNNPDGGLKVSICLPAAG